MHFSIVALLFLAVLSVTALPSAQEPNLSSPKSRPLSERDLAIQHLMERESDPELVALAEHISALAKRTVERRFAMAFPRGGGGKGGAKAKSGPGGGSGGDGQPPPGLGAEGKRAWDQCNSAQKNAGDCSAMRGPFAQMGCSLGSIHSTKPCENKDLQGALRKQYCATKPTGPGARFC